MSAKIVPAKVKRKIINVKFLISLILSSFAAIGVVTYGFKFPQMLHLSSHSLEVALGVIAACAAMLANIMLGTYSLVTMKNSPQDKIQSGILLTSLIGSVPYGFLCFFGYQDMLPSAINLTLSIIVILVNAGIGYTAIKGVIKSVSSYFGKEKLYQKLPAMEQVWRIAGLTIGIIISSVMYLATCDGVTNLFIKFKLPALVDFKLGFILALLSWVPVAALFANANQMIANEIYQKVTQLRRTLKNSAWYDGVMIIFCLFSGMAIAQMLSDSYDPKKQIPLIFKHDVIQYISHHYLITVALISSAGLNYFSLNKLKDYFKN